MKLSTPAPGSKSVDEANETLPSIHSHPSNEKRTTKSRLAAAGATLSVIAALAVLGYASTNLSSGAGGDAAFVPTVQLESAAQAAAMSSQFVAPRDDSLYPTVEELDVSPKDGVVTQKEYLKSLEAKKNADIADVNASDLPDDLKAKLIAKVNANFDLDGPCAVRAMKRIKANGITLRRENIKVLYYALDTFCPTNAVESVQQALARYSTSQIVIQTPDGNTLSINIPIAPIATPANGTFNGTANGTVNRTANGTTNGANSSASAGSGMYDTATIIVPTTSVVVDTPSGPNTLVFPVVQPGEPSTTVVVDTPMGPTVLEVPLAKPTVGDDTQPLSPEDEEALVRDFEHRMTGFFKSEISSLVAEANQAVAEEADIATHNEALDDCITQAANKFGWYGVYEEPPYLDSAIDWVLHDCLVKTAK